MIRHETCSQNNIRHVENIKCITSINLNVITFYLGRYPIIKGTVGLYGLFCFDDDDDDMVIRRI